MCFALYQELLARHKLHNEQRLIECPRFGSGQERFVQRGEPRRLTTTPLLARATALVLFQCPFWS